MTEPPSPLRMLLSRHTKRREFVTLLGGVVTCPLAAPALGRQGQMSLTSKIGTLNQVLEQAQLAAFLECAGVRHSVEPRSFQPHVAPALNQSPMLASVFHPFNRSKLRKT